MKNSCFTVQNYYLCHSIHKHDISSVYSYHAVITENALIPL